VKSQRVLDLCKSLQADILVVPDLEAGNMLAKSLSFLAYAAGIVLGARGSIILTSRAYSVMIRLASCAIAALVAKAHRSSAGETIGHAA
jgi:phosphate acetyltransferase